ncbi:hypothetical protein GCM10007939_05060 [Amylibacter marinus]|uniref:Periplasmic chaperone for outer membrane proteins Skp n=1 Tax=Amylibacter marinus TaxID=1475483 RepID=A0ABQ5VS21_9RHOB|nr:hypothetical protein GCM10007939_05060 [Amylibacter marinus]
MHGATSKIAVLDRNELFNLSEFGKHHIAILERKSKELNAESAALDAALEQEEAVLTQLRASLAPEEFQARATEFDTKVKQTRAEQIQKSRALTDEFSAARNEFSVTMNQLLEELINQNGIDVLLSKDSVIAYSNSRDITDLAIEMMNARLTK